MLLNLSISITKTVGVRIPSKRMKNEDNKLLKVLNLLKG
jgi:hypothetical protein